MTESNLAALNITPHECRTGDDFQIVGSYSPEEELYRLCAVRGEDKVFEGRLSKAELECMASMIVDLIEPWE